MRILKFYFVLIAIIPAFAFSQKNLNLLGQYSFSASYGDLNDIWGYTDEFGNEYALVGLQNGVAIVDVTNPASPVEVFYSAATSSIWRDIKTWGDYAYITNEGGGGLQIIDLSPLPSGSPVVVGNYTGNTYPFQTAHNLYIDENGVCYIFGSNYGNGGVIFLDLASNPVSPSELGIYDNYYLHDGMARGDTLYAAAINNGFFQIIDVSNKSNPVVIGQHNSSGNFTHNCWISANGKILFTTDETGGAYITAYDISDLFNIKEIDKIQSNPGNNVIPHNVIVKNNFLVTSYYRDGVVIFDATVPSILTEIANYDTSPLSGNGFNGAWGVYPFFNSGNIVASDIEQGLFILGPNYVNAAYITGTVSDFSSSTPLNNVIVSFIGINANNEITNLSGNYSHGFADTATIDISFSKTGYFPDTVHGVKLIRGVIDTVNVQLISQTPFTFSGTVVDANTLNGIANANVLIRAPDTSFYTTTDNSGNFTLTNFFAGTYIIYAGKWGYITKEVNPANITQNSNFQIQLQKGYYDDFIFDFSWSVSGNATTGMWERGIPNGTTYNGAISNPYADVNNDFGNEIYVTGNMPNASAGDDDIDDGITILQSPIMDLTGYPDPVLSYYRWFFNDGGFSTPNDSLNIYIDNGSQIVKIDSAIYDTTGLMSTWILKNIRIKDYINLTSTMKIKIVTGDYSPGHLVEAGIDKFQIIGTDTTTYVKNNIFKKEIKIFPNPFNDQIFIDFINFNDKYVNIDIYNILGKKLYSKTIEINSNKSKLLNLKDLQKGIYFIHFYNSKLNTSKRLLKN